ncbi:uncharacterized protein LOC123009763 isoform X2 [Tribolium madens]|uniref:uncharacterized protein LOC123009763 isoform X2 n=1 Tax=Tribolium madens TaxID=41895 RepID=UPI001CF731C2|nr:uncharacterized protein LOC123009763 isoform X2 [Tribolium madens]
MFRRNEIAIFAILASVCLLLVVFNQKEAPRYPLYEYERPNVSHITSQDVVKMQQQNIRLSLRDYPFPPEKTLDDYTPVTGGSPLRTIIVTTWRSGSTFLGDVLNAVPGNYYHYEPLLDYGIVQIRGPPYAESALTNLKKLLNCDYSNMENYLDFGKDHTYLFIHNRRLWNLCEAFPQFCFNSRFLTQLCQVFPFQSMKTVRIRLRLVEELLKDTKLNVKVLLLVRDPRGTLQSRKHRDWCPGAPDCDKPNLVCADMVADYSAAIQMKKLYPDRFRRLALRGLADIVEICRVIDIDLIYDYMPSIHQRLIELLKSPRSHVCRTACQAAGHLFEYVKDTRRPEFDDIVDILLHKTADSNRFIRHDANLALDCMVTHISTFNAVRALCQKGPFHKNPLVRCATVRLLVCAIVIAGPDFVLNPNNNEYTRKRVILNMARFLEDKNLDTRKLAERLYKVLSKDTRFEVYLKKYLEKEQITKIKKTLRIIHKK